MKFLLISLGSRGDIEPFLAMGNLLKRNGHEVACCFPEQFEHLAVEEGFTFFSLGTEFLELIDSEAGKSIMGGIKTSSLRRLYYLYLLYKSSIAINRKMLAIQHEVVGDYAPDQIIFHPKTVYSFAKTRIKKTLLMPMPCMIHAVDDRPPVGINFNWGKRMNRLFYKMTNLAIAKNIKQVTSNFLTKGKLSSQEIKSSITGTNTMYMISPSLFARPNEWPENAQVLGYLERDKTSQWNPSDALEDFLAYNNKPIVLSFGSMVNGQAEETTKLFLDIFEANQIPAIINISFGGLKEPADYNKELFHFVKDIPYDWIFSKVYGVIHHGGSGTSHMVTKYGCVSLIIPHIIDQFMWNEILSDQGVGPKGISIRKLSRAKLEPLVVDFYSNASFKEKATELAKQIQGEYFEEEVLTFLQAKN
jgi:UDP:flavonoid glycosyltransferase YjiC (YdhE family)